MTVPAALAGTVYEAAVGRSNGHCECALNEPGNCGLADGDTPRWHKTGSRCQQRGAYRAPLLVAPRDPKVCDRDAIGLPAGEVMVMCRGCFVRRRNKADRERAAANQAALLSEQNTLFPSDLLDPTGLTGPEQHSAA